MLEKFRKRERDDLDEGLERAAYHCFEMQFWHRELQKALRESMGRITNLQENRSVPEEALEKELSEAATRVQETALELLHHTVLLGDELGVEDRDWPEAPIDSGAWHRKTRLLMAHVSCGDDCPVSKVCELLGQMVYLARRHLTMGGEASTLEEALDQLLDSL